MSGREVEHLKERWSPAEACVVSCLRDHTEDGDGVVSVHYESWDTGLGRVRMQAMLRPPANHAPGDEEENREAVRTGEAENIAQGAFPRRLPATDEGHPILLRGQPSDRVLQCFDGTGNMRNALPHKVGTATGADGDNRVARAKRQAGGDFGDCNACVLACTSRESPQRTAQRDLCLARDQ